MELWGLLIIGYVVAWGIWSVGRYDTLRAQRKYPNTKHKFPESRLTIPAILWTSGFLLILFAWQAKLPPEPFALGVAIFILLAACFRFANRRWSLINRPLFRYWLAGTVFWVMAAAAWALIFGRASRLRDQEITFLIILPPMVAAIGVAAWQWARRARKDE